MGSEPHEIDVLLGVEAVRRRPALYVGDVRAPHLGDRLLLQGLCVAVDDAVRGRCASVTLQLWSKGRATIVDDGPGWSIEPDRFGVPWAERIMTILQACASAKESAVGASLCSEGMAVLNALCEWTELAIASDGTVWRRRFERGVPVETPMGAVEPVERGTRLDLQLDRDLLPSAVFDAEDLVARLRALRLPLQVTVSDERTGQRWTVSA